MLATRIQQKQKQVVNYTQPMALPHDKFLVNMFIEQD